MPNKYKKVTEPGKMINNIFANIGAGMEAGKNLKRCSVLKEGNTSYSDTSKPLDKQIEELKKDSILKIVSEGIYIAKHSSGNYIKTLIDKIEGLERSEKMWEKINIIKKSDIRDLNNRNIKLKKENKLLKSQLRKFGQVFDNCGGKEVDAEFNEE